MYKKKKRLWTGSEISSRKRIPMFHFWLEDGGAMCQEMWTGSKCTEQTLTLSQQGINNFSSITTTNRILPTTKMNLEGGSFSPRTSRWQVSPVHTLILALLYPKKRIWPCHIWFLTYTTVLAMVFLLVITQGSQLVI